MFNSIINDTNKIYLVNYSSSNVFHHFNVEHINSMYSNEIVELLKSELDMEGYFYVNSNDSFIHSIAYETTNSDEFSDYFVEELGELINEVLSDFANKHGGYENVKFG